MISNGCPAATATAALVRIIYHSISPWRHLRQQALVFNSILITQPYEPHKILHRVSRVAGASGGDILAAKKRSGGLSRRQSVEAQDAKNTSGRFFAAQISGIR